MKLNIKVLFVFALLIGAAVFFWLAPSSGLQAAPLISMTTIDGTSIHTKDLRGKPYMVVFWATECPGCVKEIPNLVQLERELGKQGFRVVAIAMPHDTVSQIKTMREQKGMNYDIVYDEKGDLAETFGGIMVTPTNILVSPEGKIVYQKMGEFDPADMRQRIQSLLTG